MGVLQGTQDLDGEMHRLLPAQVLALVQVLLEGDAVDVLHHDVLQPLAKAHVQHLDDVGVVEDGDGLRLVAEATHELVVGQKLIPQDLYRHGAIVDIVIRLVDVGHTAHADQLAHLITSVQTLT